MFDLVCFYIYFCIFNDNFFCIDLLCFLLSCGLNEFFGFDNLVCYFLVDDMSISSVREGYLVSGVNFILFKEYVGFFVNFFILKVEMDNGFVCSIIIYIVKMFYLLFKVFIDMILLLDFRLVFICEIFLILIDLCCCILEFYCV